jgi:hypothetical protein
MSEGVTVGVTGVEAGAHPLAKTVINMNTRKNKVDLFIASSSIIGLTENLNTV